MTPRFGQCKARRTSSQVRVSGGKTHMGLTTVGEGEGLRVLEGVRRYGGRRCGGLFEGCDCATCLEACSSFKGGGEVT